MPVQNVPDASNGGAGAAVFLLYVIIYLAICIPVYAIAKKQGNDMPWLAFIPVANLWLLVTLADKPVWWMILFFVPFVNIIMPVLVWMSIAEQEGKPSWVGILTIVPLLNIIVPYYIAFG